MRLGRALQRTMWAFQAKAFHALAPLQGRGMPRHPEVEVHLNKHGDGSAGYLVFDAPLERDSIVYSVGVGDNISFDRSLIGCYGLDIHAFDPTEESGRYLAQNDPGPHFHFHQVAVTGVDGDSPLRTLKPGGETYLPGTVLDVPQGREAEQRVRSITLKSFMENAGHGHIDLLKLDIEGGEFAVLEDLLDDDLDVRQIVLEIHPHLANLAHHSRMWGRHGWKRSIDLVERLLISRLCLVGVSERGTELTLVRRDVIEGFG